MTLELRETILKCKLALATTQYNQLGILGLLAFLRFVQVYYKYKPDQPRDERGRWTETGSEGDRDIPTGTVIQRYRTGISTA